MEYTNPPGDKRSIEDGCLCPVFDNHNGDGSGYFDKNGEPVYWFYSQCPLHGDSENIDNNEVLAKCRQAN